MHPHKRPPERKTGGWLRGAAVWFVLLAALLLLAEHLLKRPPVELVRPLPGQDRTQTGRLSALDYLNMLRGEAGLRPFSRAPELERSAADHARYLNDFPADMHDENHPENPFFRGRELGDRVGRTGYLYLGAQENLSTGEHKIRLPAQILQHHHLDGLMTAIYHRFSLLDPAADEAGIGFSAQNGRHALVVNQGSRNANRLCRLQRTQAEENRYYYSEICRNGGLIYTDEIDGAIPAYTVYPVGNNAPPAFSNETPDPLPDRAYSGNPVSIQFDSKAGEIVMESFELFQGKKKIANTRLLDADSDPNKRLSAHQFALFPLDPLEYDTEYRAVFRYLHIGAGENGELRPHTAEWTFRTKKPDYPYFNLKGGENLAVRPDTTYYLRWPQSACAPDCGAIRYSEYGGATLTTHLSEHDGVVVSVSGKHGSGIRIRPQGEGAAESALLVFEDGKD